MERPQPRTHQFVAAASEQALFLCHDTLEPAADELAGGSFKAHEAVTKVEEEKTIYYTAEHSVTYKIAVLGFADDEGRQYSHYALEIISQSPVGEKEYWPSAERVVQRAAAGQDESQAYEDDDDDEDEPVLFATEDDDDYVMLFGAEDDIEHDRLVQEVFTYCIDDEDYIPVAELKYRYIETDGRIVEEIDALAPIGYRDYLYGDTMEEDELLQGLESWLGRTFSQGDIENMMRILAELRIGKPKTNTTADTTEVM